MTAPLISAELSSKISLWRAKIADGTITREEMKEAVLHLRQGRLAAAQSATTTKRAKAMKAIPNADDLLSSFEES